MDIEGNTADQIEIIYEDEAMGMSKNLISQDEFASMDNLVQE